MHENISYDELIERFYPVIYGYILKKIAVKEDAEDLTQDIFYNIYKAWDRYDSERSSISTWLFAITNNRLKNYYRDRKINISLSDIEQVLYDDEENFVDNIINQEETKIALQAVMDSLNEKQQKIIYYRYYENLKISEIAEKINCSGINTRVILHRAIKKMKDYIMEQEGIQEN